MDMVTIFRTFSLAEADVIRGRLEADGIVAHVCNEYTANVVGAGGVAGVEYYVDVPEHAAAEARELLRAPARPK